MKIWIDTNKKSLAQECNGRRIEFDLFSKTAFEIISQVWLKIGWDQKYTYTFSWLGRPVIQNPEDLIRAQEVIYRVQPDVIIETGIAHGGSLVFYATLCRAIAKGRVIGIDIDIRPHNREALERHKLSSYITLIEGDSTDPVVIEHVKSLVRKDETVMVCLDSNHCKKHVLAELEAYSSLVTLGSYIVATDGIMKEVFDTPRGKPAWAYDHPEVAAREFVESHPEFVIEQPVWPFNESGLTENVTHWPGAWLRRT